MRYVDDLKFIAHRAVIDGDYTNANKPETAKNLLEMHPEYEYEIDVWYVDGGYWLGHDEPQYEVFPEDYDILDNIKSWKHAKNIDALVEMNNNFSGNILWHESDSVVYTNSGYLWVHADTEPFQCSSAIFVRPELKFGVDKALLSFNFAGICSPVIQYWKEELQQ